MAQRTWQGGDAGNENTWNVAANWEEAAAPIAADNILIPAGATNGIDGFDATGTAFTGFEYATGCTINIGSEATPLQLDMSSGGDNDMHLGGTGTVHLEIKDAKVIDITGAASASAGQYGLNIKGDGANNMADDVQINIASGRVGIAARTGQSAKVDNIYVNGTPGEVAIGPSVTDTAGAAVAVVEATGGTVRNESAVAAMRMKGSAALYQEAGLLTLLEARDNSKTYWSGSANITTAELYGSGAHLDCRQSRLARTVATLKFYGGGVFRDPYGSITHTNPVECHDCNVGDGNTTLEIPTDKKLTIAAI